MTTIAQMFDYGNALESFSCLNSHHDTTLRALLLAALARFDRLALDSSLAFRLEGDQRLACPQRSIANILVLRVSQLLALYLAALGFFNRWHGWPRLRTHRCAITLHI